MGLHSIEHQWTNGSTWGRGRRLVIAATALSVFALAPGVAPEAHAEGAPASVQRQEEAWKSYGIMDKWECWRRRIDMESSGGTEAKCDWYPPLLPDARELLVRIA
jgi:hypothetical protein